MAIEDWTLRWESLRAACQYCCATGRWKDGQRFPIQFEIMSPATESDVIEIEERIGLPIPHSFRKVLLSYSRAVSIEWELPDNQLKSIPTVFRHVSGGDCRWDLNAIPSLLETYREWLGVFTDPEDYFDGPWQGKFPVLEVGNGDMIAVDISADDQQPVVYLSHEGDDTIHGYWLGVDFEDYIDRLSKLGCVGAEDWQLAPFVSSPQSCLDPDGENAKLWREWFGLRIDS